MASTLGTGILRQSIAMITFDNQCLLESLDCIVAVHECMHAVVHHHEPATGGGELYIGVPSEPEDSHVVVPRGNIQIQIKLLVLVE
jgi:hypothetical protein